MLDCQVALLENAISRYQVTGEVPGPLGSRHPAITPFQFFESADGHLVVAAGNEGLWKKLCATLGLPALAADPRFATNALRTQHHAELEAALAPAFKKGGTAHWCRALEEAGVPCGPICDIAQVVADPQVQARGMIASQDHPKAGEVVMPASPLKFSATPVEPGAPAPLLGQHTDEVLGGLLGLSAAQLDDLRRAGVI